MPTVQSRTATRMTPSAISLATAARRRTTISTQASNSIPRWGVLPPRTLLRTGHRTVPHKRSSRRLTEKPEIAAALYLRFKRSSQSLGSVRQGGYRRGVADGRNRRGSRRRDELRQYGGRRPGPRRGSAGGDGGRA